MYWNHRVIKKTYKSGEVQLGIHEVFYNDDGTIYAYTENPVEVSCETIEDLREYLTWMVNCLDKEILVDGEVEFVNHDLTDEEVERFKNVEDALEFLDELE